MSDRIGFTLFLIAGGLAVAGDYMALPWLTSTGIIVFGLIAIVRGVQIISKEGATQDNTKRKTKGSKTKQAQPNTGPSANLIGATLILIGLLVIIGGVVGFTTPGGINSVVNNFTESDWGIGVILGVAGLFMTAFGLERTFSGSAAKTKKHHRKVGSGSRTGGIVTVLIGLVLLALALGFFFAPGLLREWLT